jgi:hypothetical protein
MMDSGVALTPEMRPVPAASVMLAPVGVEACLLEVSTGTYYLLNKVGTAVWNRLQAGERLGEVHGALCEQFAVGADMLWSDLEKFVRDLHTRGLVKVAG